ncbi:hypothetical protein ACGFZS_08670 [Streptomyces sp. NPDC048288]|uniref:hypothetical protein n=1 Tax=Streptomyces sp. NPDC048288 TaxID=3365529 RepID=UPI0037110E97
MALIIAAATPFHGHVQPVVTVAADLVRRGHEVVVLTGSRFAEDVRAAGALHVALPPAADFDDRRLELYFPDRAAFPTGPAQLDYNMKGEGEHGWPEGQGQGEAEPHAAVRPAPTPPDPTGPARTAGLDAAVRDGGRGTPHEAAGPGRRGARAPDHRRLRHPGDGDRTRRGHPLKRTPVADGPTS